MNNLSVLQVCEEIKNTRNTYSVLAKIVEETGELATEIAIANGDSYKLQGSDGVVGEAIDVIASCVDLIYIQVRKDLPDITLEQIDQLMDAVMVQKLDKWKRKVAEQEQKNAI